MITAKKISAELKQEVLTAIKKANFSYEDFEQNCEGDVLSDDRCRKEIESENFNITIELTETVRWSSFRDYEFEELQLTDLIITDENGDEFQDEFTDEEILNAINY